MMRGERGECNRRTDKQMYVHGMLGETGTRLSGRGDALTSRRAGGKGGIGKNISSVYIVYMDASPLERIYIFSVTEYKF